jgi:hypothetical protein
VSGVSGCFLAAGTPAQPKEKKWNHTACEGFGINPERTRQPRSPDRKLQETCNQKATPLNHPEFLKTFG